MKDCGVDSYITGAADIYVAGVRAVAESYRDFTGSATAPVKSNALQSRDECYPVLQRELVSSNRA